MALFMNLFYGIPSARSYMFDRLIDGTGHRFHQLRCLKYFNHNFELFFESRELLEIASVATGWDILEVPVSGSTDNCLLMPFDERKASFNCLKPNSREIYHYGDFYLMNDKPNSSMKMIIHLDKSNGGKEVVLNKLTDFTCVHGYFTIWFANETDYRNAKEKTRWYDDYDQFGLALPLGSVQSAIFLPDY